MAGSVVAPRVLLTVDRTFWHRLGVSRLTYRRSLHRAGARVRTVDEQELWQAAAREGELPEPGRERPAVSKWSAEQHENDLAICRRLLRGMHGLVLSGGGDLGWGHAGQDPSLIRRVRHLRDRLEFALVHLAEQKGLPILGICRGAQLMAVASGGELRALAAGEGALARLRLHRRGGGHPVRLEPGSVAAEIHDTTTLTRVFSHHSHAVAVPSSEGDPGLRVSGTAADGVVETIERRGSEDRGWQLGVQWHAELPVRNTRREYLWKAFVDEAQRMRRMQESLSIS